MQQTLKENNKGKWRHAPLGFLAVGVISAIVILSGINLQPVNEDGSWKLLTTLHAADAADGTDSIVNVYIYPLSEKADITAAPYECNEADAYEHGDDTDGFDTGENLQGSTPVGSTYIICIEVNFSSKAYNTTSSDWDVDLVKAEITCAELSLSATVMEEAPDFSQQDGSTSAHMTFYVDNGDSGWTMTTGNSITVSDVDIYYYG